MTLTPDLASPQLQGTPVTFTAAGQGASNYYYQFTLTPNGGVGTIVQPWSSTATYTLPNTTPFGRYFISAEVRTAVTGTRDAVTSMSYTLNAIPATGVTLTSDLASPQNAGTAVTFTAAGQGSSNYFYRFTLTPSGQGGTVVQNWSTTPTWTMPTTTAAGTYFISAEVRTATSGARDAVVSSPAFILNLIHATGVTLSSDLASPQAFGTPVTFTAAGQGSSNYYYRFTLTRSGQAGVVVQNWSTTPTWTMPGSTAAGTYFISAEVRTATSGPRDAVANSPAFIIQ